MEEIRTFIIQIGYPSLIVCVFVALVTSIAVLVFNKEHGFRRFVAALMPVVCLVFYLTTREKGVQFPLLLLLVKFSAWAQCLVAFLFAFFGVGLLDAALNTDSEVGPAVFACVLSGFLCVLLLFVMEGGLAPLHSFFLGLLLGAGSFIMFLGFPRTRGPSRS